MSGQEAPLCLPPTALPGPLGHQLPAGTVDSHLHVFDRAAPLNTPRSYSPHMLTLDDWLAYAALVGIDRGVLVQPSVYGLDNSVLLAALSRQPDRLRGVVVTAPDTSDAELVRLDGLGVRGVRINLRNKGGIGLDALAALAPRIRDLGWHVQFQVGPESLDTIAALTAQHQITGVIDHLAFMPLDPVGAALDALRRVLDSGRVLVKISAPYRLADTARNDGYRHVVGALSASHADRLLWASDWPHTELFDTMVDDAALVSLSLSAVPTAAQHQAFNQNATSLYWSH
ncbi:MAG: amidohydrolase family protein [Cypionkella sp.]